MDKSVITLETADFDVASALSCSEATTPMLNKQGVMELWTDFGIVMVGGKPSDDATGLNPTADEFASMMGLEDGRCPLLEAPGGWKMSHLVSRLGMFPSSSQAAKNGFGMDIPLGFSQHILRLNKKRGVITIFKFFP